MNKEYDLLNKKLQEQEIDNIPLLEMANINKGISGLKMNLWVDSMGYSRNTRHNVMRMKMQKNTNNKTTTKDLIPLLIINGKVQFPSKFLNQFDKISEKDIKEAIEYIESNIDLITKHWNGEIYDIDLLEALRDRNK